MDDVVGGLRVAVARCSAKADGGIRVVSCLLSVFGRSTGKRVFAHVEIYSYLAITGIPAVLWYRHAVAMSHESGFAIMQPGLFGHGLELWLQAGFVRQIVTALTMEAFSPVGLVLGVAGLVWPSRSQSTHGFSDFGWSGRR